MVLNKVLATFSETLAVTTSPLLHAVPQANSASRGKSPAEPRLEAPKVSRRAFSGTRQ